MTGTARPVQAVRGHLARLVVVVAVLAGLGLAGGLQCADGTSMAMPMSDGANSATAAMAGMAGNETAEPVSALGDVMPGTHGMGGLLATCLVFFVAVVVAVAVLLSPGRLGSVVQLPRAARVVVIRAIQPRVLSLAELCLLRT